jgi:sugar lactone lactonase YvrE
VHGPILVFAQDATVVTESGARLFPLPGERVFPEGIAIAEDGSTFYAGATADGTLFRGDLATREVSEFVPGGTGGLTFAVGMKATGDRLVVAGGPSGNVFVFDTGTAELLAVAATGIQGGAEMFLNDVAIAKRGEAYVTDSGGQRIYRVRAGVISGEDEPPATMKPWLDLNEVLTGDDVPTYLNGIAINASGRFLLAVDSGGKLYRIATGDKTVTVVDVALEAIAGGDGLVLDGTTLYVVRPDRISVVQLTDDLATGEALGDVTDPALSSPTTAAKLGGCLFVVNSQFANFEEPDLPFTVAALPIPAEYLGEDDAATAGEC